MSETDARPRQLTLAASFVIGGSVLLVLAVFDGMSNLNSVDVREGITNGLASSTRAGLGLSVDGVVAVMRVGFNVAAVCAAAAAVLGWFALQRSRGARAALGVLAVPILVTAPLTGGILGAVVAAAIVMLWSGPARDWYAGRPVRERSSEKKEPRRQRRHDEDFPRAADPNPPSPAGTSTEVEQPPALSTQSTSSAPVATHGYGRAPVSAEQGRQPWTGDQASGHPAQPWAGPAAEAQLRRSVPVQVKLATILTLTFCTAFVLVLVVSMSRVAADSAAYVDQAMRDNPSLARAGVTPEALLPILWVGAVLFVGWAVAAMLLAWLTWRRHDWARWLLAISAGAVLVAAAFAFPFGLPLQVGCAATIGLLFAPASRAWFAGSAGPPHSQDQPRDRSQGRPPVW